jgi:hypothetical protein
MPEQLLCQHCGASTLTLYPCQSQSCSSLNCGMCYQHVLKQCFLCSHEQNFLLSFPECLQAFYDLNIERLYNFKLAASAQRLEEYNKKFSETSHFDFPATAKIHREFLKTFVSKNLYQLVPWDFVFCYILHCERNSSTECLLWYINEGVFFQSTTQYLNQATQEQCLFLFKNLDKWYENLKGSSPSKNLLEYLEKWKTGVEYFKCEENQEFAQMFSHLLVLLKTRFWKEENSFVCCLGVLLSEKDLFTEAQLNAVGSFYSSKKRKVSSFSSLVVPPCPKKTATYCLDCNKRTAKKCQTCRRSFCLSCLNHNICESCRVHHNNIHININNISQTVE